MNDINQKLIKFANVQRHNLQSSLVDAILDAQAYSEYKEYSNWPEEEGLYVKETPGVGISLVVMADSIWHGNIKKTLREIEETPNI